MGTDISWILQYDNSMLEFIFSDNLRQTIANDKCFVKYIFYIGIFVVIVLLVIDNREFMIGV